MSNAAPLAPRPDVDFCAYSFQRGPRQGRFCGAPASVVLDYTSKGLSACPAHVGAAALWVLEDNTSVSVLTLMAWKDRNS